MVNFISALGVIKEFKGQQEYDLFGLGQVTEEQMMLQVNQVRGQLAIMDEGLAIK